MTISREEHDFIGDIMAADNAKRLPRTLSNPAGNQSAAEAFWLASPAFASYGASEEVQATFFMGWDAAMAHMSKGGDQ